MGTAAKGNCVKLSRAEYSHRFLAVFVKAYETMGVDLALVGHGDHVLELPDGRRVYVHRALLLKDVDESLDSLVWNRLAHVMEHPPCLPGDPACYHPLLLRDLSRRFEAMARERDHSYRTLILWAHRGMPPEMEQYHETDFLSRTANLFDDQMEELKRAFEGTVDGMFMWAPNELMEQARKGGHLAGRLADIRHARE